MDNAERNDAISCDSLDFLGAVDRYALEDTMPDENTTDPTPTSIFFLIYHVLVIARISKKG